MKQRANKAKKKQKTLRKSPLKRDQINILIKKAIEVQKNAFSPITNVKIGACILTEDDEFFEGCNVQSVISGLGICAERSAVDHAVVHGKYKFRAIAVASKDAIFLCGACLQYLYEFSQVNQKDIEIFIVDLKGKIKKRTTLWKTIKLYGPRDSKKDLSEYE